MANKITPNTTELLQQRGAPSTSAGNGPFTFPLPADPLRPKKVAIVGTQPSSRMLAPYTDQSWTIWGTSPGNMNILPRADVWFEMHCNFLWPQHISYGKPYLQWLQEQRFPVVALTEDFLPRGTIRYPIEAMIDQFGFFHPAYGRKVVCWASSTFAYCMAFAIAQGAEEIALFGVDMSSKDEYAQQRHGGYRMIEFALEAGIKVHIPPESDLIQVPPLYGYDVATPYGRKSAARSHEIRARQTELEQQAAQINSQIIYMRGAGDNCEYMSQIYGSVDQLAPHGIVGINGGGNGRVIPAVQSERPVSVQSEQFGDYRVSVRSHRDTTDGFRTGPATERDQRIEPVLGGVQHGRPEPRPGGPTNGPADPGNGDL